MQCAALGGRYGLRFLRAVAWVEEREIPPRDRLMIAGPRRGCQSTRSGRAIFAQSLMGLR